MYKVIGLQFLCHDSQLDFYDLPMLLQRRESEQDFFKFFPYSIKAGQASKTDVQIVLQISSCQPKVKIAKMSFSGII